MQVLNSIAFILQQLETYKNKINEVSVESSSEYAKSLIEKTIDSEIRGLYSIFVENDYEGFSEYSLKSIQQYVKALEECI